MYTMFNRAAVSRSLHPATDSPEMSSEHYPSISERRAAARAAFETSSRRRSGTCPCSPWGYCLNKFGNTVQQRTLFYSVRLLHCCKYAKDVVSSTKGLRGVAGERDCWEIRQPFLARICATFPQLVSWSWILNHEHYDIVNKSFYFLIFVFISYNTFALFL